ncbi:substrate-binding periplasmic protein [Dongshaea marina]|uniref:substrate-binding periplasmic protein n=1 Tax=Dongshaea marina TaxID=2047966 RepID=UPI000D3EDD4A|nr:transporter substrate-binding domain-containing protein [Dongshaea marina]
MFYRMLCFYCLCLSSLLLLSTARASQPIVAATAPWKPYTIQSHTRLSGIAVDIFQEIAKRANLSVELKLYPAKRLSKMLKHKEIQINFADSRIWNTPHDQGYFIFSTPYMQVREHVYRNLLSPPISTPEDLKGKRVGVVRGYYYPLFEPLFDSGSIVKDQSNNAEILLQKLSMDRIDYGFFDDIQFMYLLSRSTFSPGNFHREIRLSEAPLSVKIHPDYHQLLKPINKAIGEMTEDGTINEIIARYKQSGSFE